MKILVAGGTGAIGRPLLTELLAKGHAVVALTRSPEKAKALVEQGVEPAIADVFDPDAVKMVVGGARPEVVILQHTSQPKTNTPASQSAAAPTKKRRR
jgi:uncharacterized protein YbjT (DUF2867 family)